MDRPTLWILDCWGFFFRALHAVPPLTSSKGIPTGAVFGFARQLLAFLAERKVEYICACMDPPARSFRKDLAPATYKVGRAPLDPSIKSQLKLARAVVAALPLPTFEVPGFEADDAMATLGVWARARGLNPVIVSSDKDLACMLAHDVGVYNPQTREHLDRDLVRAKWGVWPKQLPDLLTLAGDTSDGIGGVPGIGAGVAAKLLQQHGTLEGVRAHGQALDAKGRHVFGGKRGDALRAASADGTLELCRQLVQLRLDVPVPFAGPEDLRLPAPDVQARDFLFGHLEFRSLMSTGMPTLQELDRLKTFDARGLPDTDANDPWEHRMGGVPPDPTPTDGRNRMGS